MDTAVVVALIAATTGLVTFLVALYAQNRAATRQGENQLKLQRLTDDMERRAAREARERDAEEQLARFREPLLQATSDLSRRIRNIRELAFLDYLESGSSRSRVAMLGTLLS